MPGLIGVVRVRSDIDLTKEYATVMLERMEEVLRHRPDYKADRWFRPEDGIFSGRIGHGSLMPASWGSSSKIDKASTAGLYYGALQKTNPDFSDQELCELTSDKLGRLAGFFSLAFAGAGGRRFVLATDRRASEPIYYTEHNGILFFAPEVKALLAADQVSRSPNDSAIAVFMGSGHLLAHQTLFDDIHKLPGGHCLLVENGSVKVKEYWRFAPGFRDGGSSKDQLAGELGETVSRAVARHLGDPDKTMIFLSGGVDSRGILGGALEAMDRRGDRLNTVSWGIDEEDVGSDSYVARSIAARYQLQHRFIQRRSDNYKPWFQKSSYLIDAISDITAFHPHEHQIMESIASDGFKRVLRGDETFGWQGKVYDLLGACSVTGLRRFSSMKRLSHIMRDSVYRRCAEGGDVAFEAILESCKDMEPNDAKDYLYFSQRLQTYLGSAAYYKQVFLEHRNPLLDDAVLEFLSRVPRELRYDKVLYVDALRRRYSDLWAHPLPTHSGLEKWAAQLFSSSALRNFLETELADDKSGIWDYFNRESLVEILNSVGREKSIVSYHARIKIGIYALVRQALSKVAPSVAGSIIAKREQQSLTTLKLLMRVLVLKNWHDTFM